MEVDRERAIEWWRRRHPNGSEEAAIRNYASTLQNARERKRRTRGRCVECGAETGYSADKPGRVGLRCRSCAQLVSTSKPRVTPEQVIEALRAFYAETGEVPRLHVWQAQGRLPGHMTVYRRFGSWTAALQAAGLARRDGVKG